jgi:hypothetical protein
METFKSKMENMKLGMVTVSGGNLIVTDIFLSRSLTNILICR